MFHQHQCNILHWRFVQLNSGFHRMTPQRLEKKTLNSIRIYDQDLSNLFDFKIILI